MLAGSILAELGLILACPALVAAAGRVARRQPLTPRLALRDAARHRSRTAPAVAAVLAAVSGSVAVTLAFASVDQRDRAQYTYGLQPGEGAASLMRSGGGTLDAATVTRIVEASTPVSGSLVLGSAGVCQTSRCQDVHLEAGQRTALQATGYLVPGIPVGGADALPFLAGRTSAAARAVLAAGGAVVFDRSLLLPGGRARIDVTDAGGTLHTRALPALYLRPAVLAVRALISPAGARSAGLHVRPATLLFRFESVPDGRTVDAITGNLQGRGIETWLSVERGYQQSAGWFLLALLLGSGIVTLGAAGIATGLAQADARADHATLAAVGAAPGVRRRLAAWHASSIAMMGALLGTLAGFVPAVAFVRSQIGMHVVVDWGSLAVLIVGAPLVAALLAALLTRRTGRLERRPAA
jgi:putative ABC transport system permease protein